MNCVLIVHMIVRGQGGWFIRHLSMSLETENSMDFNTVILPIFGSITSLNQTELGMDCNFGYIGMRKGVAPIWEDHLLFMVVQKP